MTRCVQAAAENKRFANQEFRRLLAGVMRRGEGQEVVMKVVRSFCKCAEPAASDLLSGARAGQRTRLVPPRIDGLAVLLYVADEPHVVDAEFLSWLVDELDKRQRWRAHAPPPAATTHVCSVTACTASTTTTACASSWQSGCECV